MRGSGRRRWVLGACGVFCASLLLSACAGSGGPRVVSHHTGFTVLPLSARGPVSAALGATDPGYRVHRLSALNLAQGLRLRFTDSGVAVGSGVGHIVVGLAGLGRSQGSVAVGLARPQVVANRVVYASSDVREWFANGPLGVEQGFDLVRRPVGRGALAFAIAASDARGVRLVGRGTALLALAGGGSLRYAGASAVDASGRALRTWLGVSDGRLSVLVDDRGARYPLRVDPLIQQGSKLVGDCTSSCTNEGTGEAGNGAFGYSVALSADGSTALVGAPRNATSSGGVWAFARSGGSWTEQAELFGTGGSVQQGGCCAEGASVALSADGDTALIGGPTDSSSVGAAWVFVRSGSAWSQQGSKLVGTGAVNSSEQGTGVALSGDGNTALIGGPGDNSDAGAAWVFTRSGSTWSQQGSKLIGAGAVNPSEQGASVALSSDGGTALIGGPDDNGDAGAAWVFVNSGGTWIPQGSKLVGIGAVDPSEQGASVALSGDGDTAVIGGPDDNSQAGAAWVFVRSGSAWSQQGSKLVGAGAVDPSRQGATVAVSGDGGTAGGRGPRRQFPGGRGVGIRESGRILETAGIKTRRRWHQRLRQRGHGRDRHWSVRL